MPLPLAIALRAFVVSLGLLFAAQATGAMGAFSCCADECPDDEDEAGCPPGCAAGPCAGPRLHCALVIRLGAPRPMIVPTLAPSSAQRAAPAEPTPEAPGHVPRGAPV